MEICCLTGALSFIVILLFSLVLLSETADLVACPSLSQFPHVIITSLLTAMKTGSSDARILFPRLLQIVAKFPDTTDTFVNSVSLLSLN